MNLSSHLHFQNFQTSRGAMVLEAACQSLNSFLFSLISTLNLDGYFLKTKCLVKVTNKFLNLTNFACNFRRNTLLYLVIGMYDVDHLSGKIILMPKKKKSHFPTEPLERRHKDKLSYHPHVYFCQNLLFQEQRTFLGLRGGFADTFSAPTLMSGPEMYVY